MAGAFSIFAYNDLMNVMLKRRLRETAENCRKGMYPFTEADDIVEYPNAVSKEFCDEMIAFLNNAPPEMTGKFGLQTGHSIELMWEDPAQKRIYETLKGPIEEIMRYYMIDMPLNFDRVSIARYKVGDHHPPHVDVVAKPGARIYTHSVLLFLNQDFVGGELEFYRKSQVVLGETGKLVMFPASFAHVHGVNEVLVGERYVLFLKLTFLNTDSPAEYPLSAGLR